MPQNHFAILLIATVFLSREVILFVICLPVTPKSGLTNVAIDRGLIVYVLDVA